MASGVQSSPRWLVASLPFSPTGIELPCAEAICRGLAGCRCRPPRGRAPPRWSCSSEKLPDEGHDLRAIELVSPCDHSTDSERMGQQKAVGRLEQEYVVAPQWLELSISSLYPPRPQACHRQLAFGCSPWAHTQVDHNSNHARVVT
ncbi:unnamed protein product [Urochloa humidicola]